MKSITYLLVLAAMAAAGCSTSRGKFTRENYETLYYGQCAPEVQKAMGAPSGITRSRWDNLSPEVQKAVGKPLGQEFDSWEYLHEKPYYRAVVFVQCEQLVGRAWYDEPSAQPASAPTGKKPPPVKSGLDRKPKKEKKKKKHPTSQPEDQEPADIGS
jgi:hypothetical protein